MSKDTPLHEQITEHNNQVWNRAMETCNESDHMSVRYEAQRGYRVRRSDCLDCARTKPAHESRAVECPHPACGGFVLAGVHFTAGYTVASAVYTLATA